MPILRIYERATACAAYFPKFVMNKRRVKKQIEFQFKFLSDQTPITPAILTYFYSLRDSFPNACQFYYFDPTRTFINIKCGIIVYLPSERKIHTVNTRIYVFIIPCGINVSWSRSAISVMCHSIAAFLCISTSMRLKMCRWKSSSATYNTHVVCRCSVWIDGNVERGWNWERNFAACAIVKYKNLRTYFTRDWRALSATMAAASNETLLPQIHLSIYEIVHRPRSDTKRPKATDGILLLFFSLHFSRSPVVCRTQNGTIHIIFAFLLLLPQLIFYFHWNDLFTWIIFDQFVRNISVHSVHTHTQNRISFHK